MSEKRLSDKKLVQRNAKYLTGLLWHIGAFVIINAFFWLLDIVTGVDGCSGRTRSRCSGGSRCCSMCWRGRSTAVRSNDDERIATWIGSSRTLTDGRLNGAVAVAVGAIIRRMAE